MLLAGLRGRFLFWVEAKGLVGCQMPRVSGHFMERKPETGNPENIEI